MSRILSLLFVTVLPAWASLAADAIKAKVLEVPAIELPANVGSLSVEAESGKLTPIWHEPTQGRTPRSFEIDPSGLFLYVANQETDNIVAFRIDQGTGRLVQTGDQVKTGSPVCVIFTRS